MKINCSKKKCSKCRSTKSDRQFYRDKHAKDQLTHMCKVCFSRIYKKKYPAKRDKQIKQAMSWAKAHPERYRDIQLRFHFGITLVQYQEMLEEQGGGCAICGKKKELKALSVDHDPKTGEIRGILCGGHNRALGLFGDDPALLRAAAAYLEASMSSPPNTPEPLKPATVLQDASQCRSETSATPAGPAS